MHKVLKTTLLCAAFAVADSSAVAQQPAALHNYTFEQYAADFGRAYAAEELHLRRSTFQRNLALILEHNAKPGRTWEAGVNHMTDRTPAEFRRLMGYDKNAVRAARASGTTDAFAREWKAPVAVGAGQLPESVDWRSKKAVTAVKDQGSCGSCWSFGAAETIESHWAIKSGNLEVLSEQNILDCTPNPRKCGGTGGCGGGTAELAYNQMRTKGIATEDKYPYRSGTTGQDYPCKYDPTTTPPAVNVTGYVKLPGNKYDPVMQAIATIGPLAINVAANTGWQLYASGVFDACDQSNPDVNHVVQLVGYGTDSQKGDYWLVRNSWSARWGEAGYIRIARTKSEETRCGTDTNPQDGVACEGDPPTALVCGTCGVIYDVSYPTV